MKFENLIVYQKSYELALSLYRFSNELPKEEKYGIVSQIKRASLSVPLNIAEGHGKQSSNDEFNRFLSMAKGSCSEIRVLLSFVKDLGYLKEEAYEKYYERYEELEKMLYGLMKTVKGE